jgi:hypothetical protein
LRSEAADVIAWLGKIAARKGRLGEAESLMIEQAEAMQRNVVEEPSNVEWRVLLVDALVLQARAQARRGNRDESLATLAKVLPLADALARQDRKNNEWQAGLGIAKLMQAEMEFASNPAAAEVTAAAAASILVDVQAVEPESERILRAMAATRNLQARLALERNDVQSARMYLRQAALLLQPAWKSTPNENLRLILAHNFTLSGLAAHLESKPEIANAEWEMSRNLMLADVRDQIPFERLDTLVRNLHYLGLEEQAHPHIERLQTAGYVPLQPWPWSTEVALAKD